MRVVARAVNDRGDAAVSSIARLTGRVTPRTVSMPLMTARSSSPEVKVSTGYRPASRNRPDRTLASRCSFPLWKLVASISTRMLDRLSGSAMPIDPDARSAERLGDADRGGADSECAAHRHEPEQVPGPERDSRAAGVDLVPS